MGEAKTSWILELIDRVTGPMKTANAATEEQNETLRSVTANIENLDDLNQQWATHLMKNYKDAAAEADKLEREIKSLVLSLDKMEAADEAAINSVKNQVHELSQEYAEVTKEVVQLEKELEKLGKKSEENKSFKVGQNIALGINQSWEMIRKFSESLNFAQEIKDLERDMQLMTGAVGEELDILVNKAYGLAGELNASGKQIADAANAMSKNMGISFLQAINLIEEGQNKGANLGGDMLVQIERYSAQLNEAGVSGEKAMAIMAQAQKDGVFGDKAIRSIVEANTNLRQLGETEQKALAQVGISIKDLKGKSVEEAIAMISQAMDGKDVQKQKAVMDAIFNKSGQSAGLEFILGFKDKYANAELGEMPALERAGSGIRDFLDNMQLWFAKGFGNAAIFIQQISGPLTATMALVQAFTQVTWLQTMATNAWSVAQATLDALFVASPIGWIALGVMAVVGAVMYAWDTFEGFREFVLGTWEVIKGFFTDVLSFFGLANEEMETMDERYAKGAAKGRESWAASQAEKNQSGGSFDSVFKDKAVLDGKLIDKNSGSEAGGGISMSGAGGSKSISVKIDIKNYFSKVNDKLDVQKIANQIAETINARVNDSLVANA